MSRRRVAEGGDEIQVIEALVRPGGVARGQGNGAGEEKSAGIARVADAAGNTGEGDLSRDAERVGQKEGGAEFSRAQLACDAPDILGVSEGNDAIDEGAGFPKSGEFLRRGDGEQLGPEHGFEIAHGGQRHDGIPEPVGTAHEE